jgi:hypothetical protein
LIHDWQHEDRVDELRSIVKCMGRSLGRVRDCDIRIGLLRYFEARIPDAALSLVLVRQAEERRRLDVMRKLSAQRGKGFEKVLTQGSMGFENRQFAATRGESQKVNAPKMKRRSIVAME